MATVIQIKRSSATSAPATLKLGELAYTFGTGTQGNNGDRLFIGEGGVDGNGDANNITVIGGQYFADKLDHVDGTLTASSALTADSNSAISAINIGNSATVGGTLKFNEGTNNGSNFVSLKAPNAVGSDLALTLPGSDGSDGHVLTTDGSGNLSFAAAVEDKPTITTSSVVIAPSTSQTFTLNGTNFVSIPIVEFIASTGAITRATAVSFTSSTAISVTTNLASGSYFIRVENNDGNAVRSTNAILSASTSPTWSTSAGSLGSFAGNSSGTLATVAASSDSTITYSVTSGSSDLTSAGVSLNPSTGALTTSDFGGSSTTATTYSFTITATDAENQASARAFSLTSSFGATGGGQFN